MANKTEVLQGTLALMVLKTLETMGPRRAKFYAITPRGLKQLDAETDRWARSAA